MESNIPSYEPAPIKVWCYSLRHSLEQNPRKQNVLAFSLGMVLLLHPILSFAILLVNLIQSPLVHYKYLYATIPVLILAIEILALSMLMIVVVIIDCTKYSSIFAVWKREAIGRLLRNTLISLSVIIACCICISDQSRELEEISSASLK